MVRILLAVLFCCASQFSFSQNWSVVNLSDKFNYKLDGDQVITVTIWADSVQWNGNDSVFFLNRVMCDTCATLLGGPNPCDTCYGLKNQPQFLQRTAYVTSSGVVNFRDTANRVILTLAALNDTWMFDSSLGITATVIVTGIDSIFGTLDSTKTILLSSGDTLRFSQNYGLLQYPNGYGHNSYYRLVGIEGRNIGERMPGFWDFFNMNVGDMFEYRVLTAYDVQTTCWQVPSNDQYCFIVRKYAITSKYVSPDTVVYTAHGIEKRHCTEVHFGMSGDCVFPYNAFIVFIDSTNHWTNKYNHQAFKLENIFNGYIPCGLNDSAYNHVHLYEDSNSVVTKKFGIADDNCIQMTSFPFFTYSCLFDVPSEIHSGSDTLFSPIASGPYGPYSITVKVGLGITSQAVSSCFEGGYQEQLVAYRKGNDTVGVFTPDSFFVVGIEENIFSERVKIFPNPAVSKLHIALPYSLKSVVVLSNLQGKNLITEEIKADYIDLDVSLIESGLYFLTFHMPEGSFTKKVLIVH